MGKRWRRLTSVFYFGFGHKGKIGKKVLNDIGSGWTKGEKKINIPNGG